MSQQRAHCALYFVADFTNRREHLGIEASGRQLEIEIDDLHQLSHSGTFQRVRRQQRHRGIRVFEIVEDYLRLAEEDPVLDFQARILPGRVLGAVGIVRGGIGYDLLKREALLQQDDLDDVVVVAEPEAMESEHMFLPVLPRRAALKLPNALAMSRRPTSAREEQPRSGRPAPSPC